VHPLCFDRFVCFLATRNKSVISGCSGLLQACWQHQPRRRTPRLVAVVNAAETTYGVRSKGVLFPTYLCVILHAIQTCQFCLLIALKTALHSLWLCGLPEDISPLSTNGSYGNSNAMVPQCPRECTPGAARRVSTGTHWQTLLTPGAGQREAGPG
jgi:hypothetical protein